MPKDPRAVRVADRLKDEPACEAELGSLASDAGASTRTLQRLFLDETGLRFSEWRQRLRLIHAASLLAEGMSVTEAGLEAGYAGSSAFIAAFRKRFGRTPTRMKSGAATDEPARPEIVLRPAGGGAAGSAPTPAIRHAATAGQAWPQKESAMTTRIGFALLGVSDLDRSIAFYRDLLGWPLADRNPAEQYARLDAGGIGLKLLGGHDPAPAPHPVFEIVVDDLDAAYAELSAKGVEFPMPPTLMPWGGRLARIADPDGHLYYLCPPE
jgi:AraC-like DNA-binding protein/predicted enzyme related to lactoylglutathione lyase